MILSLFGCKGNTQLAADIAEYGDAPITIAGLADAEFTITPNELAKLDIVKKSNYTGVLLTTFLAEYDAAPGDFALIRFIASDAYRVTLHTKTLTASEILLTLTPLAESERPLRLYIPDLETNQWIYAIERIEFEPLEVSE
jgi:hypothetical protein